LSLGAGAAAEPPTTPAAEPMAPRGPVLEHESFHYRWHLTSFLGALAGLFFPNNGEGLLEFTTTEAGTLISQLEVTSEKSADGEFWLYGAEVDPRQKKVLRAWSSYRFRGKDKEKKSEVGEEGVIDVASGIRAIRQSPPRAPTRMRIWSDGKTYPVEVLPQGEAERRIGETKIKTLHYLVRGVEVPDERIWKGSLELWLAEDEAATPVAILIKRSGLGVLLELDPQP
jgi:hypothetical protein